MYLFRAVQGLCCCARALSSGSEQGLLFGVVWAQELRPVALVLLHSVWNLPATHACSIDSVVFSHSVVSNSLWPIGLWPSRFHCPWDVSGKNTGGVCHFLLQGIFPTQGLNPCFLHLLFCRWILYLQSCWSRPTLQCYTGVGCCALLQGIFLTQG